MLLVVSLLAAHATATESFAESTSSICYSTANARHSINIVFLHMQRAYLQMSMCSTEQDGARLPILFPCWAAHPSPRRLCHVGGPSAQGSWALISH